MKIYLFSKTKKVLRCVSEDIVGDIQLKSFRFFSPSLKYPMPSKQVVRWLKENEVFLSADILTRGSNAEEALRKRGIPFKKISLCPSCLMKDRITISLGLCSECLGKEVSGGLSEHFNFMQLSKEGFYFDEIKPKYKKTELKVDELNISQEFKEILLEKGIKKLLPIQELAVKSGLLEGVNLLIVSATATGKTLIAELAGVEKALRGKKFLFAVPLVALANQKYEEFKIYEKLGLKVAIRVGISRIKEEEGLRVEEDLEEADIIVGTYEGIDGLIRKRKLKNVGIVAIDEIHNLGDKDRGAELYGFINRIKFLFPEVQLIFLSATIGNPEEIAQLLGAKLLIYNDRPIPLKRYVIFTENKLKEIKKLVLDEFRKISKFGYRGQSIVFTNSRRNSHKIASYLNMFVPARAYHAGMPYIKRKSIELEFASQKIACIVATGALASGVDFPASQVIFESLYMGNKPLTVNEFHQMLGRAGRPLYHEEGRAIVLIERNIWDSSGGEDSLASKLLREDYEPISLEYEEESILEQELANYFIGMKISEESKRKLEKLNLLGKLGKICVEYFLKPNEALYINSSLSEDPIDIAVTLEPFMNVYLSPKMKQKLEDSYKVRISSRYFDGIGVIFENPKKEFEKFLNLVVEDFLFCRCEEFPYCIHGNLELSKKIIELRLSGKRIDEIPRFLRKYEMVIYPGDVFDWLDSIIRKLEAIEAFGKKTEELRKRLENPHVRDS